MADTEMPCSAMSIVLRLLPFAYVGSFTPNVFLLRFAAHAV